MIDFYEFLKSEEDALSAVIAWLGALESEGIHIKRSALPELIHFGEKHNLVSKLVAHSYDSPQELLQEASMEGYPIKRSNLLTNPQPLGEHIDHERTLEKLFKIKKIEGDNEKENAASYLRYIAEQGVNCVRNPLRDLLPERYKTLLKDPFSAIELNVLCSRSITRCLPAEYSKTHPSHPIFRLDGEWYSNPELQKKAESLNAKYTDTVCEECFDTILENHKKN